MGDRPCSFGSAGRRAAQPQPRRTPPPRRKSVVDSNFVGEGGGRVAPRTALAALNAAEVEGVDVLIGASRCKSERPDFKQVRPRHVLMSHTRSRDFKQVEVAGEGVCFKRLQVSVLLLPRACACNDRVVGAA